MRAEGEADSCDTQVEAVASLSPLEELRELTALFRAHLEWQTATGASGLDAASDQLMLSRPSQLSDAAPIEPAHVQAAHVQAAQLPATDVQPTPPSAAERPDSHLRAAAAHAAHAAVTGAARPAPFVAAQPPPLPAPPTHGSPPPPSAAWERDRGEAQAPISLPVMRPALGAAEQAAALAALREAVVGCVACKLHEQRIQTVFSRGNGSSGLCFIGEGPGADEDAEGEPFVGKAGQLLDKMIAAMGIERDDVYVCNIVKCRPPNNRKPMPDEVQACAGFLARQLELIAPQVIVALGATAVEGLLGSSGGITRIRGRWRTYNQRTLVMPTFHPAYLLRNPKAKREVWEDLQQVMAELQRLRGVPSTPQGDD